MSTHPDSNVKKAFTVGKHDWEEKNAQLTRDLEQAHERERVLHDREGVLRREVDAYKAGLGATTGVSHAEVEINRPDGPIARPSAIEDMNRFGDALENGPELRQLRTDNADLRRRLQEAEDALRTELAENRKLNHKSVDHDFKMFAVQQVTRINNYLDGLPAKQPDPQQREKVREALRFHEWVDEAHASENPPSNLAALQQEASDKLRDVLTALEPWLRVATEQVPAEAKPDYRSCRICGFTVDLEKDHVPPDPQFSFQGRNKK